MCFICFMFICKQKHMYTSLRQKLIPKSKIHKMQIQMQTVLDADNDGKINAEDLQEALGDEYNIDEINAIIQEVDTDGTRSVSMREFVDAMMEKDTNGIARISGISGVSGVSGVSAMSALSGSSAPRVSNLGNSSINSNGPGLSVPVAVGPNAKNNTTSDTKDAQDEKSDE